MGNIYRLTEFKINQIYDIIAEFHNKRKQITLCKVSAHMEVKGNEETEKAAKQATDMPGITTTRLFHTDYYLTIRRARNSKWQMEWENSTIKLYYIKPRIEEWIVPTMTVVNMN